MNEKDGIKYDSDGHIAFEEYLRGGHYQSVMARPWVLQAMQESKPVPKRLLPAELITALSLFRNPDDATRFIREHWDDFNDDFLAAIEKVEKETGNRNITVPARSLGPAILQAKREGMRW